MPIFSPYDFDSLAGPQVERVDYRVFGEVRGSKSNQLYRLFCPDRISGGGTEVSFMQLADALRIAGIDSL